MPLKILFVDDHPLITEAYRIVISAGINVQTEIFTKNSLEEAYKFIYQTNHLNLDYIFLDLSMPAYIEKNIASGEDLAKYIRRDYPKIKIVIITGFYETIRITNLINQIYPEGIIAKGEVDKNSLIFAFQKIINGENYKSEIIKKNIENFNENDYLDNINRQIIILIAKGKTTKNMQKILNLSKSAIDKRKVKIKEYLKIAKGGNEEIIKQSLLLNLI